MLNIKILFFFVPFFLLQDLVVIVCPVFQVFEVVGVEEGHGFQAVIAGGEHVGGEDVCVPVIVEVGNVRAHAGDGAEGDAGGEFLGVGMRDEG